jgi:hypothetical protein
MLTVADYGEIRQAYRETSVYKRAVFGLMGSSNATTPSVRWRDDNVLHRS